MGSKLRPSREAWIATLISTVAYLILAGLMVVTLLVKLIETSRRAFRRPPPSFSRAVEICPNDHVESVVEARFIASQEDAIPSCNPASSVLARIPREPEAMP
jgi:hypothetical protein